MWWHTCRHANNYWYADSSVVPHPVACPVRSLDNIPCDGRMFLWDELYHWGIIALCRRLQFNRINICSASKKIRQHLDSMSQCHGSSRPPEAASNTRGCLRKHQYGIIICCPVIMFIFPLYNIAVVVTLSYSHFIFYWKYDWTPTLNCCKLISFYVVHHEDLDLYKPILLTNRKQLKNQLFLSFRLDNAAFFKLLPSKSLAAYQILLTLMWLTFNDIKLFTFFFIP